MANNKRKEWREAYGNGIPTHHYLIILAFLMLVGYGIYTVWQSEQLKTGNQSAGPQTQKPAQQTTTTQPAQVPVEQCLINGQYFARGDNPQNECQYCEPSLIEFSWINKDDGTPCLGGACRSGGCGPPTGPRPEGIAAGG